ncbi:MAG TPA: flagellar assembly protein FliW [Candidatus Acidoferrales bacterium]|nr:flagellar assembly protein FliW [Candidatus Acidoferrales bacterium]
MEQQQITVELPRFGPCSYAPADVIEFPWGLPGFPTLRNWLPLNLDSHPSFVWLQSLDDLAVAVPSIDPWMVFENYDPKLPAYAFTSLEIREAGDFTTLCVVVVTANAAEMTINLMAPVIINLRTKKGRQIVLDASNYSAREPMPRKMPASSKTA